MKPKKLRVVKGLDDYPCADKGPNFETKAAILPRPSAGVKRKTICPRSYSLNVCPLTWRCGAFLVQAYRPAPRRVDGRLGCIKFQAVAIVQLALRDFRDREGLSPFDITA